MARAKVVSAKQTTYVTRLRESMGLRIGDIVIRYQQKSAGQLHVSVEAPADVKITKLPGENNNLAQRRGDVLGKPS